MAKYAELLKKTDKEKEDSLAPARAEEQKGSLGLAIARLDLEVKTAQNELESLKGEYPLNVDAVIEAGDSLALQQRRLTQLKDLSAELFG